MVLTIGAAVVVIVHMRNHQGAETCRQGHSGTMPCPATPTRGSKETETTTTTNHGALAQAMDDHTARFTQCEPAMQMDVVLVEDGGGNDKDAQQPMDDKNNDNSTDMEEEIIEMLHLRFSAQTMQ